MTCSIFMPTYNYEKLADYSIIPISISNSSSFKNQIDFEDSISKIHNYIIHKNLDKKLNKFSFYEPRYFYALFSNDLVHST